MQFKKSLVRLVLILSHPQCRRLTGGFQAFLLLAFLFPFIASSQTTYFPQDDKANILIERMEILNKTDSVLNFSKTKPFSRQSVMERVLSGKPGFTLSKVDAYN